MSTALAMAKTTNMAKSEQPDHKILCMRGFNYRETPEIIASQPGKQQSTLLFFSIKLRSGVECNAIRLGSSSWFSQDDRRKGWTGMEKDCTSDFWCLIGHVVQRGVNMAISSHC